MGRLPNKKRGRPDKLSDEVEKRILDALRGGNVRPVAARWGGIDYATFRRWMERGKSRTKGDARYRLFAHRVKDAENQVEMQLVLQIMKAAKKDPSHAWKWLRIRREKRWSDPDRHEVKADLNHAGKVEVVPPIALAKLTVVQLQALALLHPAYAKRLKGKVSSKPALSAPAVATGEPVTTDDPDEDDGG